MTTKQPRGHELRNCARCGDLLKVYNSNARNGAGKYCSTKCADLGRSWIEKILALLPCTAAVAALALGVDQKSSSAALSRMEKKGLLHPSGCVPNDAKVKSGMTSLVLQFSAGPQTEAKVPAGDFRAALTHFIDQQILSAMPGSVRQICERTTLAHVTVTKRMAAMRKVVKGNGWQTLCFIRSYKRTLGGKPGPFIAVYDRGPGKDQPCKLKARTQREKYVRWRDRAELNGTKAELLAQTSAQRQQRVVERRQIEQGDPLLNALFGAPADRRKQERRTGE